MGTQILATALALPQPGHLPCPLAGAEAAAGGGAGGGSAIPIEHAGESWTLMVGVIDYCRQYTWREEAEWRIKNATVTKPQHYKRRFRESLHRYFMPSIEKYAD